VVHVESEKSFVAMLFPSELHVYVTKVLLLKERHVSCGKASKATAGKLHVAVPYSASTTDGLAMGSESKLVVQRYWTLVCAP
jgi:hypothetical protein